MKIEISDDVNRALRDEIYRRFRGFKKGDIKAAVEEAVRDWIRKGGKR